jgi:hypothetical protein
MREFIRESNETFEIIRVLEAFLKDSSLKGLKEFEQTARNSLFISRGDPIDDFLGILKSDEKNPLT